MKFENLMKTPLLITLLFLSISNLSCNDFVQNVDAPTGILDDDALTDERQFDFLLIGVQNRFATTYAKTILLADALSDLLVFDANLPGMPNLSFQQIDEGQIRLDNAAVTDLFRDLGEFRLLADDLLAKAARINFSDETLEKRVLFTGHLYAGIARYLYATYTGLTEKEGGGVINNGPFIPAEEMYPLAFASLAHAAANAPDPYYVRVVNSILARAALFSGNSVKADSSAQLGLQQGDAPFQGLYNAGFPNQYWAEAGRGRTQFIVSARLIGADSTDPRVLIEPVTESSDTSHWRQTRYLAASSPIHFVSWQENTLILAEVDAPNALAHINAIRSHFGLDSLEVLDTATLLQERERTLFAQGIRLVDQRRYDRFHLPVGTWQYLPFPEEERIKNPNLN